MFGYNSSYFTVVRGGVSCNALRDYPKGDNFLREVVHGSGKGYKLANEGKTKVLSLNCKWRLKHHIRLNGANSRKH